MIAPEQFKKLLLHVVHTGEVDKAAFSKFNNDNAPLKEDDDSAVDAKDTIGHGDVQTSNTSDELGLAEIFPEIKKQVDDQVSKGIFFTGKTPDDKFITLKRRDEDLQDEGAMEEFKKAWTEDDKGTVSLYYKGSPKDENNSQNLNLSENGTIRKRDLSKALLKMGILNVLGKVKSALRDSIPEDLRGSEDLSYTQDLIKFKHDTIHPYLTDDMTKAIVWMVAGESGSGKSTYAANRIGECLLRHSIKNFTQVKEKTHEQKEIADGLELIEKDNSEFKEVRGFLVFLKTDVHNPISSETPAYKNLQRVANHVNRDRNEKALVLANKMLDYEVNKMAQEAKDWYNDERQDNIKSTTLSGLVVVFDECGVYPQFTSGIVSMGREFLSGLKKRKLAKKYALVLCGSGLGAVKTSNSGGDFVGTDPALSKVITLLQTDLSKLDDKKFKEVKSAIEKGTYSRTLATNARMLARGVLPVLAQETVIDNSMETEEKKERLEAFCSFRYAMDYATRQYMKLNGLATTLRDERKRLLNKAFRYMAKSALSELIATRALSNLDSTAAKSQVEELDVKEELDESNAEIASGEKIFQMGLATRDLSQTSTALKFLACNGKAAPLYQSDGVSFEFVVALHLERFSESLGTDTGFRELQTAWPPAAHQTITRKVIDSMWGYLNENGKNDVEEIANFFRETSKRRSLVLRQRDPSAQGPDVLKFDAKYSANESQLESLELSLYQCKNYKNAMGQSELNLAAKSLGVDATARGEKERITNPTNGSAGYTYQAMLNLCEQVKSKLDVDVNIVKRVIAVSYNQRNRSERDDALESKCEVEVWSREMFEPTISALSVAAATTISALSVAAATTKKAAKGAKAPAKEASKRGKNRKAAAEATATGAIAKKN